jgi:hypothetical protein
MNESMTSSQRQTFDFKGFRETFKQPEKEENEVPNIKGRKLQLRQQLTKHMKNHGLICNVKLNR